MSKGGPRHAITLTRQRSATVRGVPACDVFCVALAIASSARNSTIPDRPGSVREGRSLEVKHVRSRHAASPLLAAPARAMRSRAQVSAARRMAAVTGEPSRSEGAAAERAVAGVGKRRMD